MPIDTNDEINMYSKAAPKNATRPSHYAAKIKYRDTVTLKHKPHRTPATYLSNPYTWNTSCATLNTPQTVSGN